MPGSGADLAELLLRFARAAAEAEGPKDLRRLLSDTAVDPVVGAAAAAALSVDEGGQIEVSTHSGLPERLAGWKEELETVENELGDRLLAAWGEGQRDVRTMPLVSGRDVFGALVIFSAPGERFTERQIRLAASLTDVVAVSLDRLAQHAALVRSYADLRASREALAQGEKLRALGQMAAGISHDLKNILNPLALQLELLRRRLERKPETAGEVITWMEGAIRSGVEIVERLRAFSRQEPEREAESVPLDEVLETAVALCQPRLKSGRMEIRAEAGGAGAVLARKAELVTAVVNLVFNAIDALGDEGVITLRTRGEANGGWIEVEDDGPGMPPEIQSRVFEPFFTTKEQGTGLGLAMVYAFAKRHGGTVTLDTKPGAGTRLRLWFPAAAREG